MNKFTILIIISIIFIFSATVFLVKDSKNTPNECGSYGKLKWENHHWDFTTVQIPELNNSEFYYGIYHD